MLLFFKYNSWNSYLLNVNISAIAHPHFVAKQMEFTGFEASEQRQYEIWDKKGIIVYINWYTKLGKLIDDFNFEYHILVLRYFKKTLFYVFFNICYM